MKKLIVSIILGIFLSLHLVSVQSARAEIGNGNSDTVAPDNKGVRSSASDGIHNPATDLLASATSAFSATYRVVFTATWSQATHPQSFPPNPHFSGLIGATHKASVTFWGADGVMTATQGIESMAEIGSKTDLTTEVNTAIGNNSALGLLSGGGINPSPGSVAINSFELNKDYPLVTLVSMVAPSPDWFVGVAGLPLFENGQWLSNKVVQLDPYDAGTDSGIDYTSSNADITPHIPIKNISGEFPFSLNPPNPSPSLGTFTFTRINYSNLNISKSVMPITSTTSQGLLTYTIVMSNSGDTDATNALLTDTLPLSTTFTNWVERPPGANEAANQITWSGNVTAGQEISLTFVVTYTGLTKGQIITNTAYFSHTSGTGQASASFPGTDDPQSGDEKAYLPLIIKNS